MKWNAIFNFVRHKNTNSLYSFFPILNAWALRVGISCFAPSELLHHYNQKLYVHNQMLYLKASDVSVETNSSEDRTKLRDYSTPERASVSWHRKLTDVSITAISRLTSVRTDRCIHNRNGCMPIALSYPLKVTRMFSLPRHKSMIMSPPRQSGLMVAKVIIRLCISNSIRIVWFRAFTAPILMLHNGRQAHNHREEELPCHHLLSEVEYKTTKALLLEMECPMISNYDRAVIPVSALMKLSTVIAMNKKPSTEEENTNSTKFQHHRETLQPPRRCFTLSNLHICLTEVLQLCSLA